MLATPQCNVTVACICAATEAQAKQQKQAFDLDFKGTTRINVVGTLEQCTEQLLEIKHRYQVDEIILLLASPSFQQRQLVYQRLAEAFNLNSSKRLCRSC